MSRRSPGLANEVFTAEERVVVLDASGAANHLDPATHANRLLLIGTADAAYSIYLPVATGSGDVYEFLNIAGAHTSGSIVITLTHGAASNVVVGTVKSRTSAATVVLFSSTANDIITLDGSTKGAAAAGDYIKLMDAAADTWYVVDAFLLTSGNQATPFSG